MRFAILLLAFLLPEPQASTEWLTLSEALHLSKEAQVPVMVYVHAPWCGPCLRLERETFADPHVRMRLERMTTARVRIDAHDRIHRVAGYRVSEAEWVRRLGIEVTPTLVFMSNTGEVLRMDTGFVGPEVLVAVIDELILLNDD